MSHSCESGILELGNIKNMQSRGSPGLELRNTGLTHDFKVNLVFFFLVILKILWFLAVLLTGHNKFVKGIFEPTSYFLLSQSTLMFSLM